MGQLFLDAFSVYKLNLKMIEYVREDLKRQLLEASGAASKGGRVKAFKGLHREQAERASYFVELAKIISSLGLSNPHEKSALTIEPTHPVQTRHLDRAFEKLNLNQLIPRNYKDYKLSLVSLEMLKRYAPASDAKKMIESGYKSPLYLLDPLYGFVYLPKDGRIHNHCFAIDIWSSHLKSMPSHLAQSLWKTRSDSMMSGGAFAGRDLFKNLIPQEDNPIKRASPPVLEVNSESELRDVVQALKSCAGNSPGVELWFRGQGRDYQTPDRSIISRLGITPYSNIRESDFTPSMYRRYDGFLDSKKDYENFVLELAEWVFCANQVLSSGSQVDTKAQPSGVAAVTASGLGSYQKGLILQQYGAPSAYLDITQDYTVAVWFATKKCFVSNGKMTYNDYFWHGKTPEEWPTIYVFPLVKGLHTYLDLDSILAGSGAKRPERQKCGLLGGAGNLARNYCARYLGLKIRLGPNFKSSAPFDAEELFPSASEDEVLRYLKETCLGDQGRQFPLSDLG